MFHICLYNLDINLCSCTQSNIMQVENQAVRRKLGRLCTENQAVHRKLGRQCAENQAIFMKVVCLLWVLGVHMVSPIVCKMNRQCHDKKVLLANQCLVQPVVQDSQLRIVTVQKHDPHVVSFRQYDKQPRKLYHKKKLK